MTKTCRFIKVLFCTFSLYILCTGSLGWSQDLQHFLPTTGDQGYLTLDGGRIQAKGKWNLSTYASYGKNPLVLKEGDEVRKVLVRDLSALDLNLTWGVHERLELGFALPYLFSSGVNGAFPVDQANGLGDLRLVSKIMLVQPKENSSSKTQGQPQQGFSLLLNWMNIIPFNDPEIEGTRRHFSTQFRLAGEYRFSRYRVALNLGYAFRPINREPEALVPFETTSGFTWGLGLGAQFNQDLEIISETFQRFYDGERSPLESLVALKIKATDTMAFTLGSGVGLGGDYSSVEFRMLGGFTWTPKDEPPRVIATQTQKLKDSDGDGVADLYDQCPKKKEDRDGIWDADGCPEVDGDRDEIPDTQDQCPLDPEDFDQFQDRDGCPDFDNDGDEIVDRADLCPLQPKEKGALRLGCPKESKDAPKEEEGQLLEVNEKVYFATAQSTILKKSYAVLNKVANLIKSNPQITRVRVEGHTDDKGKVKDNLKLSQDRAESVRQYLISQGVPASRLSARGYGDQKPIASNDTEAGRSLNRRVNFRLLDGVQEVFDINNPKATAPAVEAKSTPKASKKVATPITSKGPASPNQKAYALQVKASYRLKDVETVRVKLISDRFPAYILSAKQKSGKVIHRLRVGPYWGIQEATEAHNVYKDRYPNQKGSFVTRVRKSELKQAKSR